jgi:hypothetical protein
MGAINRKVVGLTQQGQKKMDMRRCSIKKTIYIHHRISFSYRTFILWKTDRIRDDGKW